MKSPSAMVWGSGNVRGNTSTVSQVGPGKKLVEFAIAIDNEIADAMFGMGDARRAGQARRRHEVADCVGIALAHQLDFEERSGVEVPGAGGMDEIEHRRRGIGLHRIECVAGECVKAAPGRAEFLRDERIDRLDRPQRLDQGLHGCEARQRRPRLEVHDGGPDVHRPEPIAMLSLSVAKWAALTGRIWDFILRFAANEG
ncbi:MAG TPA: hypothetical protein VHX61_07075 [Rhizomicrobium sp.]|nr:hypothetical protein [Rhizomicrobium sp.]